MNNIREALLASVKTAVAKYGADGASTRKIAEIAGVDDAYIYRFFRDKETLLLQAYDMEMTPLIDDVAKQISSLTANTLGLHLRECAGIVFWNCWEKLISNQDMCVFFNYYYHSPLFNKSARDLHEKQTKQIVDSLEWLFNSEAEATTCIYSLFTLVFDSANNVVHGRLPQSDETKNIVFEFLYNLLIAKSNRANSTLS